MYQDISKKYFKSSKKHKSPLKSGTIGTPDEKVSEVSLFGVGGSRSKKSPGRCQGAVTTGLVDLVDAELGICQNLDPKILDVFLVP